MAEDSLFMLILSIFVASQLYWAARAWVLTRRLVQGRAARLGLWSAILALFLALFVLNFTWAFRRHGITHLTAVDALVGAPLQFWIPTSMVAFLVATLIWIPRGAIRLARWARRRLTRPGIPEPPAPARRVFLERAAKAAVAAPFVAGAYGLFYGRLNLETTHPRIRLARLPRAFHGFRIAQLSDIHIGPFMSEGEIRRYVEITNGLKPDLAVLTGDFVTWDPFTQQAVVNALSGLHAPLGVFGCLGNHELWSRTEDSIARLFEQAGIRILRQARVPIALNGESLNLVGVDYRTGPHGFASRGPHMLRGIENLITQDTASILLSHNPNTFDHAAELGIDLSLAGHTHGGQVALEFIDPELAPSRLVTPYVSGWFEKPGGQLYVNRGIGTIGTPIRVGAAPEISVFELVRPA